MGGTQEREGEEAGEKEYHRLKSKIMYKGPEATKSTFDYLNYWNPL